MKKRNGEEFKTFIDLEDFDKIKPLDCSWHVKFSECTNTNYAKTTQYLGIINGKPKYKTVYLHKLIINASSNEHIDHVNHNTLDNRKSNLRKTINNKNLKNRKGRNSNNTSGYRNVSWTHYKWVVQLQVNGKNTRLGEFDDVHEAGKFAEEMRKKYYGEFKGEN